MTPWAETELELENHGPARKTLILPAEFATHVENLD